MRVSTSEMARGKWPGILLTLGVERKFLTNKHGPCPFCGGTDRYRFDDKGTGSFICSHCGAGSGFDFLKRLKGWDFKTAAAEVDKVVQNVQPSTVRKPMPDDKRRQALRSLWLSSQEVVVGDPVDRYLTLRSLPRPLSPDVIRYAPSCPVPGESGGRWAMVAMVSDPDGKPLTIHRTFLGPKGKAEIAQPRALMPGEVTPGSAIRLAPVAPRMGIAEGIETALAATAKFGLPVWAAINSTMLAKWVPPEGCEEVVIYGDNDPKLGGQAAAYALGHRLAKQGLKVEIAIPSTTGTDWADAA